MVAARHTWEIDQEIVQLTCRKEQILLDLQDPISAGKWAALQQWLAAIQAHLATLQAIIDGWRNAPGLSVTQICWVGIWSGKLATLRLKKYQGSLCCLSLPHCCSGLYRGFGEKVLNCTVREFQRLVCER